MGQSWLQWQKHTGEKVTIGDAGITPESQALIIRWPNGGFVWNRPVAVLVERGETVERIPIVDVTRVAQLALLGIGAAASLLACAQYVRQGRNGNG
jgi:hypothetical protein